MIAAFERIIKPAKQPESCPLSLRKRRLDSGYYKMGFDMVTFGMDASVMVNGFKKLVADNK